MAASMDTNVYMLRAPRREDAESILALCRAYDVAVIGQPNTELSTLLGDWDSPGFDLDKDACLALSPGGRIVGYAIIYEVNDSGRVMFDLIHRPNSADPRDDLDSRVLGMLLHWVETRAHERLPELPAGIRVCTQTHLYASSPYAAFEREGYAVVRHFWRMQIDFSDAPPTPVWPAGITVRAFAPGQDERAVWQAMNEIFEEEWDYVALPFEAWLAAKITDAEFDPTLWLLAMDGDQIVGLARGHARNELGWIRTFGVRRQWRHQGVGLALLRASFGEFYRRGKTGIGLGVDALNPTGATSFYERAGMHVALVYDTYQKELRAGKVVAAGIAAG